MRYGSKGIKMKRIMIFVAFMFLPCVCIALTMCVRDSAMVVSLEPAVAGLSYVADEEEMAWLLLKQRNRRRVKVRIGALIAVAIDANLNPSFVT